MKVIGVIPARYGSTRFPGKPLKQLHHKPLIQHVYERAAQSKTIDQLIVATDDQRIITCVHSFGGKALLTPTELPSGTDRCAHVAQSRACDMVVNIQGDEPFLDPDLIDRCVAALQQHPDCPVATAARRQITPAELTNPNVVKVLVNRKNEALYFSRQNIPYIRDGKRVREAHPALKHIGLYVFRKVFLLDYVGLAITPLERLEKLEQLRILENGAKIFVVKTSLDSLGIDTPADLEQAERILEKNGA